MSRGMSGRSVPNDGRIIDGPTEKVSQSCSAAQTSAYEVIVQNPPYLSLHETGQSRCMAS